MRTLPGLILTLLSVLFLIPAQLAAQDTSRTILVLDASGSMWGQIDGKAKITIAQEVIGELLQTLPPETELGLTVYGHRRKGDCSDIETLILPGGDQRAAISGAVNAIRPKGKTPLSAAVIAAAEALRFTEERATVILVSDGKETCDYDPCEVGRRLEESGVDFTAHVIGFDISDPADRAELQCLAEETGGTFRTASNAAELGEALAVVAEPEPTPTYTLNFIATDGIGGPVISQGLTWSLGSSKTGPFLANAQPGPSIGFSRIPQGTLLFVQVTRQKDGAVAELSLVVDGNTPGTSVLVLPEPAPVPQMLTGVARESGSNRTIDTALNWTISDVGGKILIDNQLSHRPGVSVLPGNYHLTVVRPEDGATASRTVEVKDQPLQAILKLPALVVPAPLIMNAREEGVNGMIARELIWTLFDKNGQVVLDHVSGPTASTEVLPGRYRVEVLRTEDEHTETLEFAVERNGTTVTVTLPPYLPPATLNAADTAVAGSDILVDWTGPDEENDYVTVVEPESPDHKYLSYEYTRNGPTVTLTMPAEPGRYELRYVLNESRQTLVRRVIEVTPVEASLTATDTAIAGATIPVDWTGPNYQNDFLVVAKPDAPGTKYINYEYTRGGSPAKLQMPTEPGSYELRYVMSNGRTILASRAITVSAVAASISAPDSASAGSTIPVEWTGPDYQNDFLVVAEPDAPGTKYINYEYTRGGSPAKLQMPTEPGDYELRYIMSQGRTILATRRISVSDISTSLSAPDTATAGATIKIDWVGPDYQNDFISVAKVDDPGNKYATYAYTRDGNPLKVTLPLTTGDYELRYVISQDRSVAARMPITISPASANLEAAAGAVAGSLLDVTWTGPDYKNDFIAIANSGSKDTKYLTYSYVRDGSPLQVQVPSQPGSYELRYVAVGTPRTILARIRLEVGEVSATLQADASAPAGGTIVVTWEGPDYRDDYIALSRLGDNGQETYAYTRNGSPVTLKVPDAAGSYEIRYVISQDRREIAKIDLTVE